MADAWADLQSVAASGKTLEEQPHRLAFADPEFMFRRETRGIRLQLEMLKPDLAQIEQGINNTVVVFGSARFLPSDVAQDKLLVAQASGNSEAIALAQRQVRNAKYYDLAREFGQIVATYSSKKDPGDQLFIVTGGGPGIMEAANRGAHDQGALNVGLNITLPHEQHHNPYTTPSLNFKFHYFALRKMHFMMRAKALVVFPGGFGTLDELFEVITLVQTKKVAPVPVVLIGKEYWKRVFNFEIMLEEGVISPEDLNLISYVDLPQEAWTLIKDFYHL